jgi:hypothetical protein
MPFDRAVAPAQSQCRFHGIDTMNTLDLSPKEREELGGLLSSEVVSQTFCWSTSRKGLQSSSSRASIIFQQNSWGPIKWFQESRRPYFYQAMTLMRARRLRPWLGCLIWLLSKLGKTGPGWRAASRCGRPTRWTSVSEPRQAWLTKPTKWKRQLPRFHFRGLPGRISRSLPRSAFIDTNKRSRQNVWTLADRPTDPSVRSVRH